MEVFKELKEPAETDIAECWKGVVQVLSRADVIKSREEVNKLAMEFALMILRLNKEWPLETLAETVKDTESLGNLTSLYAIRFVAQTATHLRLTKKANEQKEKPSEEVKKALRSERKAKRLADKQKCFGAIQKLGANLKLPDEHSLKKLQKSLQYFSHHLELSAPLDDSMISIFFFGLTKTNADSRLPLLQKFISNILTEDGLNKIGQWIKYYRPLLQSLNDEEVITLFSSPVQLLLKRSSNNFPQLSLFLQCICSKMSFNLFKYILSNTLNDFLSQDSSTLDYQNQFLSVVDSMLKKLLIEGDIKYDEFFEALSYPYKQLLGNSGLDAIKQLHFIRLLVRLQQHLKGSAKPKLLQMIIEFFGGMKESSETTLAALEVSKVVERENCLDMFNAQILQKAFLATESKDLHAAFLQPLINIGVAKLVHNIEQMKDFMSGLPTSNWKTLVNLLNFNAVTMSNYNMSIVAFYLLLMKRDTLSLEEEEKEDSFTAETALYNFICSSKSVINKLDFVRDKEKILFDSKLQLQLLQIFFLVAKHYIQSKLQIILPTIVNILMQYSLSPLCETRNQAISTIKTIFSINTEMRIPFAICLQDAIFAFLKYTPFSNQIKIQYLKRVISALLKMYSEFHDDSKASKIFLIKQFILIHSSKANGMKNSKNFSFKLAKQMWESLKKIPNTLDIIKAELPHIFKYLTSGYSTFTNEIALASETEVGTILNVVENLAKNGLGKEILVSVKTLLKRDRLIVAEKLAEAVLPATVDSISHFEIEFLIEEIQDLLDITGEAYGIKKPQHKVTEEKKQGKKVGKKTGKKNVAETLSKEEVHKKNFDQVHAYVSKLYNTVKTETQNILLILRKLFESWDSSEILKSAIETHLIDEILKIIQFDSVRFDCYLTLRTMLHCYRKNKHISRYQEAISEAYFTSIISSLTRESVKNCSSLFKSLSTAKINLFDDYILGIILNVCEFLAENKHITSSLKVKVMEVMTRIILECKYNPEIIHRITPIFIKIMHGIYMGENLEKFIQVYWIRATYNDMYDVIKSIYQFDPSHQIILLKSIFAIKRPCPSGSWFSNTLFHLLFNENKDMEFYAKALFNERTIVLKEVLFDESLQQASNLLKMLNFKSKDGRDTAVTAIAGHLEICKSDIPLAIKLSIEEFEKINPVFRGTIANLLSNISAIIPVTELKTVFTFLLKRAVASISDTSNDFMEAGIKIIQDQGSQALVMINAIEELISQGKTVLSDNANTIAAIFIGNLSRYLSKDDPKLPKLFETLQEMLLIPSHNVRVEVAKCLAYFSSIFKEESLSKINKILFLFQATELGMVPSKNPMRAQAFALAGFVKGLGLHVIEACDMVKIMSEPFKEKAGDTPLCLAKKENALFCTAALSDTLGRAFEYYGIQCMPFILQSFSSAKESIRFAAQSASKSIISKLTGQGVKTVLPTLIKELETTSWRSKLAAVECLGTMAFMAPKQLSNHLPQIVSNIKGVLNDTQPKVHQAGITALTAIGSVIKNPEIADISGKIILTLKNPTKDLILSLDLLLQQSFAHAIDAPSLSLIIPILDYGLRAQNNEVKKKATQLVGNMCQVIGDPTDMLPYLPVIIPALKAALFDSIPEVRTCSAKALGSLVKGLGLHHMQDIIVWIKDIMKKPGSPVERSGSANAYAEIIAQQGTAYLDTILEELIENTRHKEPCIREGYIGLFLFLPLSFGETFEKYFTLILPIILEALTDAEEVVRNSANRVVQICIRQYGKKRTDVLLGPLLKRILDTEWRIRESSLNLMGELLVVIEADMIKSKPKHISEEDKDKILSTIFISRYDSVETIRVTSAQIWKGFVDNPPKTMKRIIPVLINDLLEIFATRTAELKEIAMFALKDIAEKYGEKMLFDILSIYQQRLEFEDDIQYITAIAGSVKTIVEALEYRILTDNKKNIYVMMEPFIDSDEDDLRTIIASIFVTLMQKDIENNFQYNFPKTALKKMYSYGEDADKQDLLQDLLHQIVEQKPKFGDIMLNVFGEEPLDQVKIRTLTSIIDHVVTLWFNPAKSKKILERLFDCCLTKPELKDSAINCLQAATEYFENLEEAERWVTILLEFAKPSDSHLLRIEAFLKIVSFMFKENEEPIFSGHSIELFDYVISLIQEEQSPIPSLVTECIEAITSSEEKENQHGFVVRIKKEIDNKKRALNITQLSIFNQDKALDYYLPLFQNTLMHASVEFRVEAAAAYRYAIELTTPANLKTSAAKLAGSLIRVVNDKFPFALKNELFEAMYLLIKKCGPAIRAFVSPLQTTLVKAIKDPEFSAPLRMVILKNLSELLKLNPKSDSLRGELFGELDSSSTTVYSTCLYVLALIGKMHGAQMKPEVRIGVINQLIGVSGKLTKQKDEDFAAALGFALANFAHQAPEANSVYEFPVTKLLMETDLHCYIYFPLLFSPFIQNPEGGYSFLSQLLGKIQIVGQEAFIRLIGYLRFFIQGSHADALEFFFAILDGWLQSMSKEGWETNEPMLSLIPFSECEGMKIHSPTYFKLKSSILTYIAQECEFAVKENSKELIYSIFEGASDIASGLSELEKSQSLSHKTTLSISNIMKSQN